MIKKREDVYKRIINIKVEKGHYTKEAEAKVIEIAMDFIELARLDRDERIERMNKDIRPEYMETRDKSLLAIYEALYCIEDPLEAFNTRHDWERTEIKKDYLQDNEDEKQEEVLKVSSNELIEEALEISRDENIEREERIEKIAKIGQTTTDLTRIIYVQDELDLEEGQIIQGIGHHWSDLNDKHFQGYNSNDFAGTPAVFTVNNVNGFKIPYFHEIWGEENNVSYEERLEILEYIEDLYYLIGTEEELFEEAEVLVSNDTKFEVTYVEKPNEETDYYQVELEVI